MENMTLTFSFDHALTEEELAVVNELHRLATNRKSAGETVRQAVAPATPTNTTSLPQRPSATAKELTEADVRAAMAAAKSRIWGANHATDPALTKEAKAPLVEAFKAIARQYGAEKPSLLPSHAARENFIRHISTLTLGPNGSIVESDLPF